MDCGTVAGDRHDLDLNSTDWALYHRTMSLEEFLRENKCSWNEMEYWRLRTQNARKHAMTEETLRPIQIPYTDPSTLAAQFAAARQHWLQKKKIKNEVQIYFEWAAHSSSTPLSNLEPNLLQQMKIRQLHKGHYLLCRTISAANCAEMGFAASFAIEDADGWAQKVTLYNYPGVQDAKPGELDTMFPINTTMIIREPYVKMEFGSDGHHIEIQSPSDLILLEPDNKLLSDIQWKSGPKDHPSSIRTATQWKKVADRHLMAKEYFAASVAYSNALRTEPSLLSARIGRSMTNFHNGAFIAAQNDAEMATKDANISQADKLKALYQAARAAYSNDNYEQSTRWFLDCSTLEPNHKGAKEGVQACVRRLKEARNGDYDWAYLFEKARAGETRLDVSDYTGPLKIVKMKNRGGGRGVVTTRDIKPGELLAVSKPFASASAGGQDARTFRVSLPHTGQVAMNADFLVFQHAVSKCALNPTLTDIYDLYDGNEVTTARPSHGSTISESTTNTTYVDVGKLRSISIVNSFAFHATVDTEPSDPMRHTSMRDFRLSGLWILPSYINHSCAPNVERCNFADAMVLRSARKIKEGEELTMTYAGHDAAYDLRTRLLKHYGITCDCSLCDQDRAVGEKARELRPEIVAQMKQPNTSIPRLLQLAKKLNDTYPSPYSSHKWDLYQGYQVIIDKYFMSPQNLIIPEMRSKMMEATIGALEALNVHVVDSSATGAAMRLPISIDIVPYARSEGVSYCVQMVMMMVTSGNTNRAKAWLKAGTWIENARYGGGIPLFRVKYRTLIAQLGGLGDRFLDEIEKGMVWV